MTSFENIITKRYFDEAWFHFTGKENIIKYFAKRIIAYYNIGHRDICTFALGHALKMEKTLGFTGLVYQEMLLECITEKMNSLSFVETLMSISAKDILCSAAMGSCNVEVHFLRSIIFPAILYCISRILYLTF